MKTPKHVRNRIDLLEYKKDVLEKRLNDLIRVEASQSEIKKAHAKFFKAYLTFANVATRAAEQGVI